MPDRITSLGLELGGIIRVEKDGERGMCKVRPPYRVTRPIGLEHQEGGISEKILKAAGRRR